MSAFDKAAIDTGLTHKRIMSALLSDPAVFDNEYEISTADGFKTVSYHYDRFFSGQGIYRLYQFSFIFRIHISRSFVKDYYRRILTITANSSGS